MFGHDLDGGVGLRYAVHGPDRVDQLVLSNAVAYDSWPVQAVTDLGLPETTEDAERLEEDVDDETLIGLEDAANWVVEDRPEAYREHLEAFLLDRR